jgi:hypothetical protein
MNDIEINDSRMTSDFKSTSFSKFARSKVKKELLQALNNYKIEPACYWSVELICAGHFQDLWDILLLYMSRYIHIGNPKLSIYMDMRFQTFKTVIDNGYINNELALRNNDKIRKLFAELICILVRSRKKHAFESLTIKDINEFDITNLTNRLKAPNISFGQQVFKKDDPKELFIAINEFSYHLLKSKDITSACYWVEWVLQFDNICKRKKIKCTCERRSLVPVNEKYQMDIIWIIWHVLIIESSNRKLPVYSKIIKSLLNLYCIKFNPGVKRRRKYLIYSAINFLTENINFDIPLVDNKEFIENISNKINIIYKEVKKNEITPNTDYLFTGVERSNIDKSIEKLEKLDLMLQSKSHVPNLNT